MSSSNKNTTAYVAYILVSISWYFALVSYVIFSVMMLFGAVDFSSTDYLTFNSLPLDPDILQFKEGVDTQNLTLSSAVAEISLTEFLNNNPGHRAGISIFIFFFMTASLYGLYQLKSLLKSTVHNDVFNKLNIRRLRIIAFLVMLIDPLHWMVMMYVKTIFNNFASTTTISIELGGIEQGYFMIGLLLFVLATVFERGYEMYQELKLTV